MLTRLLLCLLFPLPRHLRPLHKLLLRLRIAHARQHAGQHAHRLENALVHEGGRTEGREGVVGVLEVVVGIGVGAFVVVVVELGGLEGRDGARGRVFLLVRNRHRDRFRGLAGFCFV